MSRFFNQNITFFTRTQIIYVFPKGRTEITGYLSAKNAIVNKLDICFSYIFFNNFNYQNQNTAGLTYMYGGKRSTDSTILRSKFRPGSTTTHLTLIPFKIWITFIIN